MKLRKKLAILLAILICTLIIVCWVLDFNGRIGPPVLLAVLDTVFLGAASVAAGMLASRLYMRTGCAEAGLVSAASLAVGTGAALAGWLQLGSGGVNAYASVLYTHALVAGVLNVLAALHRPSGAAERRGKLLGLWLTVAGVTNLAALSALAAASGFAPVFYADGEFTPLCLAVLFSGGALSMAAAGALFMRYQTNKQDYIFWRCLSALMFAFGLLSDGLGHMEAGAADWLGSLSFYFSGMFYLISVLCMMKRAEHSQIAVAALNSLTGERTEADPMKMALGEILKMPEVSARHTAFAHTVKLSQRLINTPVNQLDKELEKAMEQVGRYCGADRLTLYAYDWNANVARRLYGWSQAGSRPVSDSEIPLDGMAEAVERHRAGEAWFGSGAIQGTGSDAVPGALIASYPLMEGGQLWGFLSLESAREMTWDQRSTIEIFCQMIAGVLSRREREAALAALDETNRLMLDAMHDGMALIDRDGTISNMGRMIAKRAGMAPDAAADANIRDLLPEEKQREGVRLLEHVFNAGVVESFEVHQDAMWFDYRFYPLYRNNRAVAVLMLSTDITDRKKAAREAARFSEFERTVVLLTQEFINTPIDRMDAAVNKAMEQVACFCGADRSSIYIYDWEKRVVRRLYGWDAVKDRPAGEKSDEIPFSDMPEIVQHHREGKPYFVSSIDETPAYSTYRQTMRTRNSLSTANFPLLVDGRLLGTLGFSTADKRMSWTQTKLAAIEIFGQMICNVLLRKEKEVTIRLANEREKRHAEFERIILSLARNFIKTPLSEYQDSILPALENVSEETGADRVTIYRFDWDAGVARHLYEWDREPEYSKGDCCATIPIKKLKPVIERAEMGLAYLQKSHAPQHWKNVLDEATSESGCLAGIVFPIFKSGRLFGMIEIASVGGLQLDPSEAQTRIFSEMASNMLERIYYVRELQEANESNRMILDSTYDGVAMLDRQGTVLSAGRVFAEQFGKTPQEIVGANMRDFNTEAHLAEFSRRRKEAVIRVFETGIAEAYEDCRDGIWLTTRICPVFKRGEVVAVTLFSTDITDKKKAEEEAALINKLETEADALHQRERDYLEMLDGSTDGSWIYDIQSGTVQYSEHWAKLIGADIVPPDQRLAYAEEMMHPEDREIVRAARKNAIENRQSKYKLEYRTKTVEGGYIWVLGQSKIVYNAENLPLKIYGTSVDITKRKRAEEALRENELQMRTFLDNATDFMFIKDRESRVVLVNRAYENTFDLAPGEAIGKTDLELYGDEELARVIRENDQLVMDTNRMLICQESVMTREGYRTYSLSKVPWRDTNGNILGVLGTAHDITEIKNARDELQETVRSLKRSNECIELLYEISDSLLGCTTPRSKMEELCGKVMRFLNCDLFFNYLIEEDGQTLRLNASTGLSEKQMAAVQSLPFGTGVCGRTAQLGNRRVIESIQERDDAETVLIRSVGARAYACHPMLGDGTVIGTLAFCTCSRDSFSGEELALMKAVADSLAVAVKRKQAEEALRESGSLLSAIINGANDSVFLKDRQGRVLMANEATTQMYGRPLPELIGRTIEDLLEDRTLAKTIQTSENTIMDNGQPVTVEERLHVGNQRRTFLCGKTPWQDNQGRVIGLIGIARDITERIDMEYQLRRTAEELSEKNALITEFFVNVSHEFRTPISVLQLAMEIMREHNNRGSLDGTLLQRNLSIIEANTHRLNRLVGNLMDITKIDAGFMQPSLTYVDIVELLSTLVDSVKPFAMRRKLKMSFICRYASCVLQTDAEFVERIVINLLSNAIKHTAEGGRVRVRCENDTDRFVIMVEDNGEGIPEDKKQIIFDRFRQVNNSLARSSEGCGIGLSLSKSLAELLGGSIRVESTLGSGSVFFVELPKQSGEETAQKQTLLPANMHSRIVTELSDICF